MYSLHFTAVSPKQLFHHKFLKVEFVKINQRESKRWQKVGRKRQSEIWNRSLPNKTTIFSLGCCRQALLPKFLLSSRLVIYLVRLITQNRISEKRWNYFERFKYVDFDNTFYKTKLTTSNSALSSYQAVSPCALHSELRFLFLNG